MPPPLHVFCSVVFVILYSIFCPWFSRNSCLGMNGLFRLFPHICPDQTELLPWNEQAVPSFSSYLPGSDGTLALERAGCSVFFLIFARIRRNFCLGMSAVPSFSSYLPRSDGTLALKRADCSVFFLLFAQVRRNACPGMCVCVPGFAPPLLDLRLCFTAFSALGLARYFVVDIRHYTIYRANFATVQLLVMKYLKGRLKDQIQPLQQS